MASLDANGRCKIIVFYFAFSMLNDDKKNKLMKHSVDMTYKQILATKQQPKQENRYLQIMHLVYCHEYEVKTRIPTSRNHAFLIQVT